MDPFPAKIVSGGQTGVDRAALDVALAVGFPCGGWCPAGRWAEDGIIPERYPLRETASGEPDVRTRENVRDSDGTLVLLRGMPGQGTLLTMVEARRLSRPLCVARPADASAAVQIREWLQEHRIRTLNVAGQRESEEPGIYGEAARLLTVVFDRPLAEQFDHPVT